MRRFFIALFAICVVLSPAAAQDNPAGDRPTIHVISEDMGGILLEYIAKYVTWEKNGDTVRIEGSCVSACTVVLGIIPASRICATRNSELAFHSAVLAPRDIYTEEGTRLIWFFYHGRTERVLARHGWGGPSEHADLIIIDAQEIVRPCDWEDYHGK